MVVLAEVNWGWARGLVLQSFSSPRDAVGETEEVGVVAMRRREKLLGVQRMVPLYKALSGTGVLSWSLTPSD